MTWAQRLLGQAQIFMQALEITCTRHIEAEGRPLAAPPQAAPEPVSVTIADADTLPEEARRDLKGIWRVGLDEQKAAIKKLSNAMRNALQAPGSPKDEMKHVIQGAAETYKTESAKSIDETTEKAIKYIENLPEDKRDAAADYWGSLSKCMLGFLDLAMNAVFSGAGQFIEILNKIWEVDERMEAEVDRAYQAALWLLK